MSSRILNITACCFVAVWSIPLHGQGPTAESVTQSVLDQHKSADPTNSARALTGKSQEFNISKIPPPSGPSARAARPPPKTLQRIHELEKKQKKFVSKEIEKQSTEANFVAFNATTAERKANQDWEKTEAGKTLRRLKAEVAEASKARRKTEFDISGIPLPRSSPK
jgi:hypothetical protein